ncbi:MAG: hypothetical protein HYX59_01245 [Elusimicrobia bacterium]|nr:hypothetical protein [Elusimicrobiota bacterium]
MVEQLKTIIEQIKDWFLTAPLGQAVLLAFIQAYGWFWIHVLFVNMGTYGPNASADGGLGTIVMGWFWALIWGWVVCWPLSRRIIGTPSLSSYIFADCLAPPALLPLMILIGALGPAGIGNVFKATFTVLGLGVLPEGRLGFASIHAQSFLEILFASLIGFYLTAKRRVAAVSAVSGNHD